LQWLPGSYTIPVDAASVSSLALAIAIIWRIISYYPYLIIGASIAPGWIQRNFVKPLAKKK
jgi:glycosyltransferase 2 family protein